MNSHLNNLSAALLLATALLASPALAAEDASVIARIGETEIKADEIRASLENLDSTEQAALARDPSLLNQVVRSLLVQRLVFKEALAKGWDKQPTVAAQVERAREKAITESYLRSVATPGAGFPSDTELQAAYDANKAALLAPKQYRLAQIFVPLATGAEKAAADKAQIKLDAIRKSLRAPGADFAAIAREDSEEPTSAERGGEIGWLAETQIQPEIRTSIVALGKSTVSEPIRLGDGWHIVKVLEVKEAYTPALSEVREQLAQKLRAERTRASTQEHLAKTLQQNPVAINELALSSVLKKPAR